LSYRGATQQPTTFRRHAEDSSRANLEGPPHNFRIADPAAKNRNAKRVCSSRSHRSGAHVIHHTSEFAATRGIQVALLAGLGLTAALGLRYPLKMLPILLFELAWKAIYLIAFALPLWSAHQINDATAEDIKAVLMVVIFIPLIPWRYVFAHYVLKHGDRWK
jgi:hypothetical protein